jgi:hypothetical protein
MIFAVSATALQLIRGHWVGEERSSALSIYVTLAELQALGDQNGFEVPRREIARRAGVSIRTADKYMRGLRELGLLERHYRRQEGGNLPNRWAIA